MKEDISLIVLSVMAGMLLTSLIFLTGISFDNAVADGKVPILIMSETEIVDYCSGQDALLIEYYVGGLQTNAVIPLTQMYRYNLLLEHLKESGRLQMAKKEWWDQ